MVDSGAASESRTNRFSTVPALQIHVLARLFQRHSELYYRRVLGLKTVDCRIVGLVGALAPVSFKRICEAADMDKSYASRLIARLVELGYLSRDVDPADHRSIILNLLPKGEELNRALYPAAVERSESLLSVLDADQRRQFLACVELLMTQARKLEDDERALAGPATLED
jgi:DNA-binding MarR family transcriptional regulator